MKKLLLVLLTLLPVAASFAAATLSWTDNSNNETGFEIERAPKGRAFAKIGTVGANVTTYLDATAKAGDSYSYRVRAFNGSGFSLTYTNIVEWQGVVPANPVSNFALALLRVNSMTPEGVPTWSAQFTWVDTNTDEGSYRLEYRKQTDPEDKWTSAGATPANATAIVSPFISDANTRYFWRVVTIRGDESPVASAVVATEGAITYLPTNPTGLKIAP